MEGEMQAILIQQRCLEESKGNALMLSSLTQVGNTKSMDEAKNEIILCLTNKVLREH